MAYGSNYNGNSSGKRESVYTKGFQFYNSDDQMFPGTLQLSHWDDFASIKINPAKPVDQRTENSIYDYDTSISTAIGMTQCIALYNGAITKIDSALETQEQASVGVVTGGNNQLAIYTNNGVVMLMVFKDIDYQTRQPKQKYGYVFNKTMVVENYNPEDGTHSTSEYASEYELFKQFLHSVIEAGSGAYAHQSDFKNRFKKKPDQGGYKSHSNTSLFGSSDNQQKDQQSQNQNVDTLQYASDLAGLLG